jgi:hypothetical protein
VPVEEGEHLRLRIFRWFVGGLQSPAHPLDRLWQAANHGGAGIQPAEALFSRRMPASLPPYKPMTGNFKSLAISTGFFGWMAVVCPASRPYQAAPALSVAVWAA